MTAGLNLLGDCVVDPMFDRKSGEQRLHEIVDKKPGWIGIGLPQDSSLEIRGRTIRPLDDDWRSSCCRLA